MWSTTESPAGSQMSVRVLRTAVEELRGTVLREGEALYASWEDRIVRASFAPSARNLASYLALRRRDLRELQVQLMSWGLSSLGRCEARVLENLDAVAFALARLDGAEPGGEQDARACPDFGAFFAGNDRLRAAATQVLGPEAEERSVRIMVTLPSKAADDPDLVRDLVARGMDVARINCAHDGPEAWRAMAAHVRAAEQALQRPCRICADICGPRARTRHVRGDGQRIQAGDSLTLWVTGREQDAEGLGFTCSLPEIVGQLRVDDAVSFDGGRLQAVVFAVDERGARLRVTAAAGKGVRLREGKGLNFPDTPLVLDALTAKDRRDLDVIVDFADIVGYSFVQRREDVEQLQAELAARGAPQLAIAAKVETQLALRNLPEIIVQAAGRQPLAVMLARGDLAVELGYRRLAEIQEELLWLCEAAHVPVVWATEVLDSFVRSGVGARAEITDAAMGERAECVMLNKGPHAGEGVSLLADVLGRMESHQYKKTSRMRALRLW